jgi:hypothetical protein
MSPHLEDGKWSGNDGETEACPMPMQTGSWQTPKEVPLINHIKQLTKRLFQAPPRGNVRPKLGQMCLIMTGETGRDEGQMGIISDQTPCMVRVTYVCDQYGKQRTKLKRPSSLVMLDPRVTMSQDANGTVWIRPC